MTPTIAQLQVITGRSLKAGTSDRKNADSVLLSLAMFCGDNLNRLAEPNQLAQYFGQLLHESNCFMYDHEIWGPTEQQKKYEPPSDLAKSLGNKRKGDGYLFRGRTAFQVTGGYNYGQFSDWSRSISKDAPDFYAHPDLINVDPWEGLAGIWYWGTHGCIPAADRGSVEEVTRCVNGSSNGLSSRANYFVRTALVFCGYKPTSVAKFQADNGLKPDGDPGPQTQSALTASLRSMWEAPQLPLPPVATPVATDVQEWLDKGKSLVLQVTEWLDNYPTGE